ncbi:hypothetical protein ANRL2_03412 [Anaerolineae bacterium]|nr:hypothetical protein ANRL2_03412 [Anaerolineae bacterium]
MALFALLLLPAPAYAGQAEEFVKGELTSMLPWEASDVEVDEVAIPGLLYGKGASFRLELPKRPSSAGKVSFKVEVREKGVETRAFWGSARVKVFKDALVAMRTLKMRTRIKADDVKLSRVELGDAAESFSSIEELSGMVAKRPIVAGSVIRKDYVRPETVIRRGDKVSLRIEGPSIMIRSKGIAAEDGHMGAVVGVRTASGKEVAGRVSGPGEVAVGF